jgi:hypothetical protein
LFVTRDGFALVIVASARLPETNRREQPIAQTLAVLRVELAASFANIVRDGLSRTAPTDRTIIALVRMPQVTEVADARAARLRARIVFREANELDRKASWRSVRIGKDFDVSVLARSQHALLDLRSES